MDDRPTAALPVMLNLSGRPVVVVGGGAVGMRKAAAALAAGAVVKVVDPASGGREPTVGTDNSALTGTARLTYVPDAYRPEHLDGTFLVFACATSAVNARVVADARARALLVDSASNPVGDFTLPSVVRSGDLTVAVSTGGAAPALARRIREKLEAEFDGAFAEWVRILAEVRAVVLTEVPDPNRRHELLDGFADWPWLERLRTDGADAVKEAMLAEVRREKSG